MCGIAGIFSETASLDTAREEHRLRAALTRIRHRGPDDSGRFTSPSICLGHVRLAILDLSPLGHQPMRSKDGRLVVTFNGEIYNYLELRRELQPLGYRFETGSDTEVLLAAYAEWGRGCVARFRGMFAFALWDAGRRELVLARDRTGEKPLYYHGAPGRFVFASELKALLELMPGRPAVSAPDVDAFLHYQFVIEPGTLLEGVRKLPPAHLLVLGEGRPRAEPERYWALAEAPPLTGDPPTRVREALESAVEMTLRSDAPVAIGLSGGLDSSAIAALAARKDHDLRAFTVGYPGAFAFDERAEARALSESLGIPWYSVELRTDDLVSFFPQLVAAIDEPIADMAAYGHYAVARLAAEHGVKVLLTGIGGDELFFGYGWTRDALRLSKWKLALEGRGGGPGRLHARLSRALLGSPTLLRALVNHRLPRAWIAGVDRFLDAGRLDLDHPDDWVFYQLDYNFAPADSFVSAVYADAFRHRVPPRASYRLMRGLRGFTGDPQIAIAGLLFDSWLTSNCLALGDRVSMASSVEVRVPMLDANLIETVVGFWKSGRTEDSEGHKVWFREAVRDLLPPGVAERPKRGFLTPTLEWMEAINARYADDLADGVLVASGVVDPDRLRRWLAGAPPGVQKEFFRYKLTLLETWHRTVLE